MIEHNCDNHEDNNKDDGCKTCEDNNKDDGCQTCEDNNKNGKYKQLKITQFMNKK